MNRKTLSALLAAALLLTSLSACSGTEQPSDETTTTTTTAAASAAEDSSAADSEESETESDSAKPEEAESVQAIENLYSDGFKIERLSDGIKRVTDADNRELILVPREKGIPAEYSDSIVIRTPVNNAVFLSSTQVCTFRAVDDAEIVSHIGGVCGGAESWADIPAVAEGITNGDIIDVTGDASTGEPDYEKIAELSPDVVFVYSGEYGQQSQMAKLDELGINYAVDNEYLESDYMARMEWMRFILTFFNADDAVDEVMTNAQKTVDEAKAAIDGTEPVKIAVFNVYDGTVYGTSPDGWFGTMLSDMNGVNVFADMPSTMLTLEAAYEAISTADVIVYSSTPSWCPGMEAVVSAFPQLTECKAYENNNVYQYTDLYWMGIDQSDIMAADIAAVMFPEAFEGRELSYFVKLEK